TAVVVAMRSPVLFDLPTEERRRNGGAEANERADDELAGDHTRRRAGLFGRRRLDFTRRLGVRHRRRTTNDDERSDSHACTLASRGRTARRVHARFTHVTSVSRTGAQFASNTGASNTTTRAEPVVAPTAASQRARWASSSCASA